MAPRIYPNLNTSSASSGAANRPVHRRGEDVDATDQVASPILLGIGAAGSVVALLLIRLLVG